jgi:hypothetical protein
MPLWHVSLWVHAPDSPEIWDWPILLDHPPEALADVLAIPVDPRAETDEHWLTRHWEACPYCHSPDISADQMEYGSTQVWQNVECLNCEKIWREVYTASHREEIT